MSRAIYEVLPKGNEWLIRMASDSAWEMRATKAEAIARARELARRYGDWRVRVLSDSGEVEAEYSEGVPT